MEMSHDWLSFIVWVDDLKMVHAQAPSGGPLVVKAAETWVLDDGDRVKAYAAMRERVRAYLDAHRIGFVAYRAAAGTTNSSRTQDYLASEHRGVVLCAVGETNAAVRGFNKASVSKTFGQQTVGEHVKDEAFWAAEAVGDLPRTHREAALYLLAARTAA